MVPGVFLTLLYFIRVPRIFFTSLREYVLLTLGTDSTFDSIVVLGVFFGSLKKSYFASVKIRGVFLGFHEVR